MTYTFWHAGNLVGESDLAFPSPDRRMNAGLLHPTAYGLTLLPGLTRMLTITSRVKRTLDARGCRNETLRPGELDEAVSEPEIERDLRALGRVLKDMEVKQPDGSTAAVAMMTFTDVDEMGRVGREVGAAIDEQLAQVSEGIAYYVVSVVFKAEKRFAVPRVAH